MGHFDNGSSFGRTRSGKEFTPFQPIRVELDVDFSFLLQSSLLEEANRISNYSDEGSDDTGISALHDLTPQFRGSTREIRRKRYEVDVIAKEESSSKHANAQCSMPELIFSSAKSDSHRRRKYKRQRLNEEKGQLPREKVFNKHIKPAISKPLLTGFDFSNASANAGAYSAKRKIAEGYKSRVYGLEEVLALGFQKIEWDARQISEDRPIVDSKGRVIAVLVAPPKQPGFKAHVDKAFAAMLSEGQSEEFLDEEKRHCRGTFSAINVGVTHAKGTLKPVNLNNKTHAEAVQRLLQNESIRALAGFASASFAAWGKDVYLYYKERLDQLFKEHPDLKRNFNNSTFPAATFNLGPNVFTCRHRDVLNCPFGRCAIQALGDFNPKLGGHIVLWELRTVVEFPPGALILIPSATITHCNIPVSKDERRLSFTQYAAGGLFRYVDYAMRTENQLKREQPSHYAEMMRLRPARWKMGVDLLTKVSDLQE